MPASTPTTAVASPCINVCHMNATTGWCEGCFRTLDEIAAWSTASDDEKRQASQAIAARRAQRHPVMPADDAAFEGTR